MKTLLTLLPVEPVFRPWARSSERESLLREHQEKRALQIRQMSARRKIIAELVRRTQVEGVWKDLACRSLENHLLSYDHYETRSLFWSFLKDSGVGRDSFEQMKCLGRDIIEKVGYSNPEEKEDLAISLFPFVLVHLYPPEEMPRLARCTIF